MAEVISVGIPVVNFNPLYALPPGAEAGLLGTEASMLPKQVSAAWPQLSPCSAPLLASKRTFLKSNS